VALESRKIKPLCAHARVLKPLPGKAFCLTFSYNDVVPASTIPVGAGFSFLKIKDLKAAALR
jgi:hypothetical protein